MTSASVRCRIVAFVLALALVPLAHAELPQLNPVQMLGPDSSDSTGDANTLPSPPLFGYGLALRGNMALAGMPGAYDERGRVAALVRNAAGKWIRIQTLTASSTSAGSGFLRRDNGTLACLYSWSASQVVQRVCFTSSSIIATTA